MLLTDFHFDLPDDLIANRPLPERSASRLLCLDKKKGELIHRSFKNLIDLLTPLDLLVLNNTRVMKARLLGQKASGGKIELLVERILDDQHFLGLMRASKKPKVHSFIQFAEGVEIEVLGRQDDLFHFKSHGKKTIVEILDSIGQVPLPPYMKRVPNTHDQERYQTIYALQNGSVAAPTAGLHFDEKIFTQLADKGIAIGHLTLHVGAGTFVPVRSTDIRAHQMHSEFFSVSPKLCEQILQTRARGGRVIAVGTTTVRSLETASREGTIKPMTGWTNIFIYPGFQFQCVDALITNFHLPGSTLLMLVAAFGGRLEVLHAYKMAIQESYRFYSYGDAMWIG